VISGELQDRGGVDAGSAISLAEHLIAVLDAERLMIVRRSNPQQDLSELIRKLKEEAKEKRRRRARAQAERDQD
jgi:hypothetical protein